MNILGMFARFPQSGQVKTRLAATIGDDTAALVYQAFLEDQLERYPKLSDQFCVAVTPGNDAVCEWFQSRLPAGKRPLTQPLGDLGTRIDWYFKSVLDSSDVSAVLVGSDSPDLPEEIINSAFERLQVYDMVFAPAFDGGFVLVGLSRYQPGLFDSVNWSSATTLTDALSAAGRNGLSTALLAPWYDVDTIGNLGTLTALLQSAEKQSVVNCPRTTVLLKSVWPELSQRPRSHS